MITALACLILTSIPSSIKNDWSIVKYSWEHMQHGFGNIMSGTLEAIPLVGQVLYFIRAVRISNSSNIITQHEHKFLSYQSLVDRDFKFVFPDITRFIFEYGYNHEHDVDMRRFQASRQCRDKYDEQINALGGFKKVTQATKLLIAKEIVASSFYKDKSE